MCSEHCLPDLKCFKWCYMTFDITRERLPGVFKKVEMQADAISGISGSCDVYFVNGSSVEILSKSQHEVQEKKDMRKYIFDIVMKYDAIYFRWGGTNRLFNELLRFLSLHNKLIVIEIPTYPIKGEMLGKAKGRWEKKNYYGTIKSLLGAYILEDVYLRKQKKFTDMFVFTAPDAFMKGVRTVNILNGIDPAKIIRRREHSCGNVIKLLAVANVSSWHGFDRVIRGLAEYHGKRKIEFVIVGQGSELDELKRLVLQYALEDAVLFRGLQFGEDLDKCFDECDIAVGSLGLHRLGITPSSLKSREYMARGIPFVASETEAIELDDYVSPYVYMVPGNNQEINIEALLEWIDGIDMVKAGEALHTFALTHCTWKIQMQKVLEKADMVWKEKYESGTSVH